MIDTGITPCPACSRSFQIYAALLVDRHVNLLFWQEGGAEERNYPEKKRE